MIIDCLTDHATSTTAELSTLLRETPSSVKKLLCVLISEEIIVVEGGNRKLTYRLKS